MGGSSAGGDSDASLSAARICFSSAVEFFS
jgi:hypothetical protein